MMITGYLPILVALLSAISAATVVPEGYVLKATQKTRETFVKGPRARPEISHEVVIAVKQKNIDVVQREALERATPGHEHYQHWLSYEEITSLVINTVGSEAVISWCNQHAIEVTWVSRRGDYIKANAPVSLWESVLKTEFFVYTDHTRPRKLPQSSQKAPYYSTANADEHLESSEISSHSTFIRGHTYHLPVEIHSHVQAIFNVVDAPPVMHPNIEPHRYEEYKSILTIEPRSLRGSSKKPERHSPVSTASSSYNGYVTVSFLNDQYEITTNMGDSSLNQSVFQTNNEYFSPTDLTEFQETFDLTIQGVSENIGNHSVFNCSQPGISCTEGNLDIQYIMGVAQKTASIFWWVSSDGNPFLTWITDVADDPYPPQSNSISWGSIEILVDSTTLDSFDTEASKLAAMGVTITVATGDNGAPSYIESLGCLCNYDSSSDESSWTGANTWTGVGYFPSFPATSPWLTAVGATMGNNGGTSGTEVACQSQLGGVITTGGGFSTYYATPSYQTDYITNYFNEIEISETPISGYNIQGRAYPDISYIGVRYLVTLTNELIVLYGTSASSPVMAAMVTLVNTQRMKANMTSIGFINPTLYATQNQGLFTDVTSGHNKCCAYGGSNPQTNAVCCNSGFYTATGWDPVTGLGIATYPNLCSMFNVTDGGDGGNTSSDGSSDGLSSGAIAGIVIVVLVVVVGGAAVGFAILCKKTPPAAKYAADAGTPSAPAVQGRAVELSTHSVVQGTIISGSATAVK